ncbi:MAG TPA: alpha/beta hydrolase [Methanocella sp.]|uniref:alpha/beta fold hydrolase n=1 Tax=Methanocella sp. TaxID=2052833 RepID=UPI002C7FED8B|nr:alpha/beta hydrolase [Methanocella sp.]HTY91719.1 alpha/beta hydrolase [Methanocella sp.]
MLEPGEHDALLNGVRVHYTVSGSGPALIAIYGGPGMDARGFESLADIGEFVTLIVMHPRGSGLSAAAPCGDGYLLGDYAADVEALRRHLRLDRPAVLGWSHGGMIAQQFAFTYPDSLSKLVLLDTSAYFGELLKDINAAVQAYREKPWFPESYAALQKEWAGEYRTDEDMTKLWADEIRFYFREFDGRAEAYRRRTMGLPLRMAPLKCFNELEAPCMDLRPRLAGIKAPTLVIVGRHDFITTAGMSEEIHRRIPGSRLEIFEGSGHFTFVEEPGKLKALVRDFILE